MATLVEDIVKALKNLGGQAALNQIYAEVKLLRTSPLPKSWQANIRQVIESHSSDSHVFKGKDLFHKVGKGIWAIRNRAGTITPPPLRHGSFDKKQKDSLIPESFETISNILRTIKEYREYSNPASSAWIEYIREFFHIMGFSTEKQESRLYFLKDMGGNNERKAIVGIVFPGENFEEIIPDMKWETHLRFAANYYQLGWGILINGLELKVINYGKRKDQLSSFWPDLDGIIKNQKLDTFFTIYKVFSNIKNQKKEPEQIQAPRHDLRLEFWKGLLNQSKTLTPSFKNISPSKENWISIGAGKSGLLYSHVIRMKDAHVELYIDQGDTRRNKRYFDTIYAHKEQIEQTFGKVLDWQRLDEKRGSRVRYLIDSSGLLDRDRWPELQKQMIKAMIDLQKALGPEIKRLK